MDFIPDKEFHALFDRVSRRVSLKGCNTPEDVNRRLRQKEKEVRFAAGDNPLHKLTASNEADFYRRLVPAFGKRVIDEVHSHPNGKIAKKLKDKLGFYRKWKRTRR